MSRAKLTKTQAQILAFVKTYAKRHGWPPTRSEINEYFGWSSQNAAQSHLRAIEHKGYIQLVSGGHRKITIL